MIRRYQTTSLGVLLASLVLSSGAGGAGRCPEASYREAPQGSRLDEGIRSPVVTARHVEPQAVVDTGCGDEPSAGCGLPYLELVLSHPSSGVVEVRGGAETVYVDYRRGNNLPESIPVDRMKAIRTGTIAVSIHLEGRVSPVTVVLVGAGPP